MGEAAGSLQRVYDGHDVFFIDPVRRKGSWKSDAVQSHHESNSGRKQREVVAMMVTDLVNPCEGWKAKARESRKRLRFCHARKTRCGIGGVHQNTHQNCPRLNGVGARR